MSLVRDPAFWKRFSIAAHKEKDTKPEIVEWDPERADSIPSTTSSMRAAREHDQWLEQQERKKRKHKAICLGVFLGMIVIGIAVGVTVSVVKR